jgi:RNA polymerase sigma factor (TIGR02999 family)
MKPAFDHLEPVIYEQLKSLARRHRARIFAKKGLGTRSIVHEAYLKLSNSEAEPLPDQKQFLLMASSAMRSVLVDNARHWMRDKRGGKLADISMDQVELTSVQRSDELLELDKALIELSEDNPRLAKVVTCRFFGGLSIIETADAIGISPATVKRDWILARTLLYQVLSSGDDEAE